MHPFLYLKWIGGGALDCNIQVLSNIIVIFSYLLSNIIVKGQEINAPFGVWEGERM